MSLRVSAKTGSSPFQAALVSIVFASLCLMFSRWDCQWSHAHLTSPPSQTKAKACNDDHVQTLWKQLSSKLLAIRGLQIDHGYGAMATKNWSVFVERIDGNQIISKSNPSSIHDINNKGTLDSGSCHPALIVFKPSLANARGTTSSSHKRVVHADALCKVYSCDTVECPWIQGTCHQRPARSIA